MSGCWRRSAPVVRRTSTSTPPWWVVSAPSRSPTIPAATGSPGIWKPCSTCSSTTSSRRSHDDPDVTASGPGPRSRPRGGDAADRDRERATAGAAARLTEQQWRAATDCTRWTVRDVAVHLIASAQAQANPIEFVRQVVAGRPLTTKIGGQHWVDGLNEAQLRSRTDWTWPLLADRWERHSTAALKARQRMPAPV